MNKFLLTSTLALVGMVATAQTKNLSVPLRVQEHSQWCWAGSAKMITDFKGKTYTQCAMVNYAKNINYACGNTTFNWNSYANQPNTASAITYILNGCGVPSSYMSGYLSYSSVQSYINASKPFVVLWSWTNGGGHFVVGKGYSNNGIYFNDPWPGSGSYYRTYSASVSASDRRWTYTNYLR